MKVAVIGMAESCAAAPWVDATWEKWGLPWHPEYWARMDRLFEMHDRRYPIFSPEYIAKLSEVDVPLYMQETSDIPCIQYPLDAVEKTIGRHYWTSSVAYMVALAIHEGAEEIALYGVDINENEYGQQRPCLEYLLGIAHGKGISIRVQDSSLLLKFDVPGCINRYGWLG